MFGFKKNKETGDVEMKHTVELKLPKFLDGWIDKYSPEEKVKFGRAAMACGGVVLGIATVYLMGYNRGIKKAIDNRGVYLIQSKGN